MNNDIDRELAAKLEFERLYRLASDEWMISIGKLKAAEHMINVTFAHKNAPKFLKRELTKMYEAAVAHEKEKRDLRQVAAMNAWKINT